MLPMKYFLFILFTFLITVSKGQTFTWTTTSGWGIGNVNGGTNNVVENSIDTDTYGQELTANLPVAAGSAYLTLDFELFMQHCNLSPIGCDNLNDYLGVYFNGVQYFTIQSLHSGTYGGAIIPYNGGQIINTPANINSPIVGPFNDMGHAILKIPITGLSAGGYPLSFKYIGHDDWRILFNGVGISVALSSYAASVCSGNNSTSIIATPSATGGDVNSLSYQWRSSANGGITWNNLSDGGVYSGSTTSTLQLTNVDFSYNAYKYSCLVSVTGPNSSVATGVSTPFTLSVNANKTAGVASSNPILCINTLLPNITIATTGATGIGTATGLPAGVNASFSNNTITISGIPTESGVFDYSIPLIGGCGIVNGTGRITVNSLTASVIIVSNANNNSICSGASVTFTATPTNGGTSPSYQWRKGGGNIPGETASTYTTTTLASGDILSVVMTSNASPCLTGSPATSNSITITVNPAPNIIITETDNSGNTNDDNKICIGASVTLTASGATTYSWISGEPTAAITKSPAITTTYTVTGANSNACINTATKTVVVNALPIISITPTDNSGTINNDAIICAGSSATLTASGALTYSWNSAETTTAITKSPATNTTYTVTGTDANGCVASQNASVTVSSIPVVTLSNASFCLGSTATLNAIPLIQISLGNFGPIIPIAYTYNWTVPAGASQPGNVPSFSTTTAGTYKVYITNTATNCQSAEVTGIVTTILPITGTASVCNGAQTQLTGSGTPAVSNPWTSSNPAKATVSSTGLVTGVAVGTTNITYTNADGCSVNTLVTVNALPAISGALSVCSSAQTQLTGSGTPATINAWTSSNTATATVSSTGLVTGILAGTTTITYTNSAGCSANAVFTVNVLAAITGTTVVCSGAQTQLTGSGTPANNNPWTSSNTANATIGNTGLVTGVLAGTSTITYTNAVGCSANAVVTVNALPVITGVLSICSGAQTQLTGSAIAATSNAWTSSNTSTATVNTTGLVTGVAAGTATITYTNAVGCSQIASFTVKALPTISGVLAVCKGAQTQLTGSGTAATSNAWTSSNPLTASVSNAGWVTGILAGTSTITYTNSLSCSQNAVITVKALPVIDNITTNTCTGSQFSYTPPNGFNGDVVPLGTTYSWANPIVTGAITGGGAGTNMAAIEGSLVSPSNLSQTAIYTVTPSAAGCIGNTFSLSVVVHPIPATPVITASSSTTFCIGGTVNLSSNAATGNQWYKNGVAIHLATGTLLDVADAGSYTIVVSLNGCSSAASTPSIVTVNQLPVISVSSVPANAAVCAGSAASLTASGAASYNWSGGVVNGVSFIPSQTDVYTVTGTDVNGCTNTKTATIIVNPLPPIPVVNNISYCQNDLSKPLLAKPVNSNTINWYHLPTGGIAIATPNPNTLVPGIDSFYVTQTNALGCESPRATLVVTVHALPIDSILTPIQDFICNGSSISLLASNNYSYQWFNNGVAITGATSNSYLAYLGGTYSFQMTSQFGCTSNSSNSKSIQLIKKPSVNFTYDSRCLNALIQFVNTSNFANSGNILWKWDFGNGSIASLKEGFYAYPAIGNYTVTLTATPSDCPLLADSIKQIFMIEAPVTGVNYGAVNAKAKVPYLLKAREIGKTYLWDPFTGLSNPSSPNPTASLTAEQRYTVRITNNAGCVTQDSILVRIFNDYTVFVPSGFSPDGDGVNDKLTPLLVGVREMKSFRMYNRWGQLLYQTTDKNAGWNGTFNGKQQVSETYVWVVEAIDEDGKTIQKTGKTTLIR